MKKCSINNCVRGWFIGDYKNAIYQTNIFEAAIQKFKAGDISDAHLHRVQTEITVILNGSARMNGEPLEENDAMIIYPNEVCKFEAITDVTTCVIKFPGIIDDKEVV